MVKKTNDKNHMHGTNFLVNSVCVLSVTNISKYFIEYVFLIFFTMIKNVLNKNLTEISWWSQMAEYNLHKSQANLCFNHEFFL